VEYGRHQNLDKVNFGSKKQAKRSPQLLFFALPAPIEVTSMALLHHWLLDAFVSNLPANPLYYTDSEQANKHSLSG